MAVELGLIYSLIMAVRQGLSRLLQASFSRAFSSSSSVLLYVHRDHINPCTAPDCIVSGLKDARSTCKQYIFRSYNPSAFKAMRFDNNSFICQCEKENRKDYGFQISHYYWSFSSEIIAMKGLKDYQDGSGQDVHLDFHTAPELSSVHFLFQWRKDIATHRWSL